MKNNALFHKTVDVLIKAYYKGSLRTLDSSRCAVGALVAAGTGYIPDALNLYLDYRNDDCRTVGVDWFEALSTHPFKFFNKKPMKEYVGEAKFQIDSTGYTPAELQKIENAFMAGWTNIFRTRRSSYFRRLNNVLNCLMEIHEFNADEIAQSKNTFKI